MSDIPETIGRYPIIRRLGEGGMGTLYLAHDPALDRQIAIKLLREDSDDLRERFMREARIAAKLSHENIVTIYEVGASHGHPFIAMAYIAGETLKELIQRRAPLSVPRKLTLIEQLCAGLAYAHRAGIIHRDIKPANLIVDDEESLKILDFGVARLQASEMTRSGAIMGTLNYMSPELVSGQPIDRRNDVFAVGAVLFELLAYRKAFPGPTIGEVWPRILYREPDQFAAVVESLDPGIVQILTRSLEKNVDERYQDLAVMRKDIFSVRSRLERDETSDRTITMRPHDPTIVVQVAYREAIAGARAALDALDIDTARNAIAEAERLDPDSEEIHELRDRLISLVNVRQARETAELARRLLDDGMVTAAHDAARRAEMLTPDDSYVRTLLDDVKQARAEQEEQQARLKAIAEGLWRARTAYEQGAFESAVKAAADVLTLDAANDEARALIDRSRAAMKQRAQDEEDRRLRKRVADLARESKRLFAEGQRTLAIDLLAAFQPLAPEIQSLAAELRTKAEAIARREREATTIKADAPAPAYDPTQEFVRPADVGIKEPEAPRPQEQEAVRLRTVVLASVALAAGVVAIWWIRTPTRQNTVDADVRPPTAIVATTTIPVASVSTSVPAEPRPAPIDVAPIVAAAQGLLGKDDLAGAVRSLVIGLDQVPGNPALGALLQDTFRRADSRVNQARRQADASGAANRPEYAAATTRLQSATDLRRSGAGRAAAAVAEYLAAAALYTQAARQFAQNQALTEPRSPLVPPSVPSSVPPTEPPSVAATTPPTVLPATPATTSIRPTTSIVPLMDLDMVTRLLSLYAAASRALDPAAIRQVYPNLPDLGRLRVDQLRKDYSFCEYTFSNPRFISNSPVEAVVRVDSVESCKPKTAQARKVITGSQEFHFRSDRPGSWTISEIFTLQ